MGMALQDLGGLGGRGRPGAISCGMKKISLPTSDRHPTPVFQVTPTVLPRRAEHPGAMRASDAATVRATGTVREPEPAVKIATVR
jgi:hypothetical protein